MTGILEFLKRDAQQKEQMRIWTQEQIYEKERIKQLLKAEKEYGFKCIFLIFFHQENMTSFSFL